MAKIIGRQVSIGLGKETTRGTVVAPAFEVKQASEGFDDKFDKVNSEVSVGTIADSDEMFITKIWSEGKIDGHLTSETAGLALLAGLGAVSSAVKETTAYEHTFTLLESNQHPTLTVDVKRGTNEHLAFGNAVISALEISASPNEIVKLGVELKAKKGVASTTTPSYVDETRFVGKNVSVKLATDLAGLDGASAINIRKMDIKINKDVEADHNLGSVEPTDFYNGQFVVTGTLDLVFDSTAYKTLAFNGTQKALRVEIVNSDVVIGAVSNPSLTIDLAKVKFTEYSVKSELKDISVQHLVFKAYYSLADAKMITAKLVNEVVSY
jgi:hypothetical protein